MPSLWDATTLLQMYPLRHRLILTADFYWTNPKTWINSKTGLSDEISLNLSLTQLCWLRRAVSFFCKSIPPVIHCCMHLSCSIEVMSQDCMARVWQGFWKDEDCWIWINRYVSVPQASRGSLWYVLQINWRRQKRINNNQNKLHLTTRKRWQSPVTVLVLIRICYHCNLNLNWT